MDLKVKKVGSVLGSLGILVPLYIVLHEGGHALVAAACGARITRFSILGAYMQYEGGVFTPAALSLFHAAGVGLPVLVLVVWMLAYRGGAAGVFYRIFSFLALLLPLGALLAWVAVPVLDAFGKAPQGDDVTRFIHSSGLSPWTVLSGAVLLLAGCIALAWRKRIIQNYWAAVRQGG